MDMKPLRTLALATLVALSFSAHAVGSLATVTVFDRAAQRELPVYWHEGRAYVVGKPGNEYQVTVRNRAGEDLLAVVSVDGVNVLSGETASPRQGGYVVTGGDRLAIRGWRKSMDEIASFYFTSLGDSYAARTGRPDNVGVIGVALFKRKPQYDAQPYSNAAPESFGDSRQKDSGASRAQAPGIRGYSSEDRAPSVSRAPAAPLGTGHGERENSPMRWTQFERSSYDPVEMVTIHYDSYRNLAALGVLHSPVARDPRPFPGFAADPPR
jgi:hypothetical protein